LYPTSIFNKPIPEGQPLASNSNQIVARLNSFGQLRSPAFGVGLTTQDWSRPIYFAKNSDPTFRIHGQDWVNPDTEGVAIHIPAGAKPAGGSDGSMGVVQPDGWEYDFWSVRSRDSGQITAGFCWRGRSDGNGLGTGEEPFRGGVTAARYSLGLGLIREEEMEAGHIDHAIFMEVRNWHGRVYPSALQGGHVGEISDPDAPPMGAHFQLDPSLDLSGFPRWKQIVLRAMQKYGLYVGDNGGSPWYVWFESEDTYRALGQTDPWRGYWRSQGISVPRSGPYSVPLASGVDWTRLRVLQPPQ
jgi:hypothetical protein